MKNKTIKLIENEIAVVTIENRDGTQTELMEKSLLITLAKAEVERLEGQIQTTWFQDTDKNTEKANLITIREEGYNYAIQAQITHWQEVVNNLIK